MTEKYHDDLDFIPIPMDEDSSSSNEALQTSNFNFKFTPPLLKKLRNLIEVIVIPSEWTRVPKNLGAASHGSLKAAEWLILYKLYIPILLIVLENEGNSLPNQIMENTFHLISALNI